MVYLNSQVADAAKTLKAQFDALIDKRAILRSPEIKKLFGMIKDVPAEQRKQFGAEINALRLEVDSWIATATVEIDDRAPIDVTAPFDVNTNPIIRNELLPAQNGTIHPLMQELETVLDIFYRMGFTAIESREIDDDYHMFGALNFPEGHPARDDYDTFMTTQTDKNGKQLIAPAHTSTMQHRVLKKYKDNLAEGKPIAVVIPGRVFRNEDLDARHEHTFYQLEGVYVGKGIHAGNLIATLKTFLQEYYQQDLEVKTQPYYFPFTEPSFEFALSCPFCKKAGCNVCSQSGWIELLGCGMIHPNVLREAGIDPTQYTGFAWGGGIDRLVMMKNDIEDIRHFESAKLEFFEAIQMKISVNTAQYFSNVDIKSIGRERLVEKIGAQLGSVDEVVDWAPKFEGVIIARVVSCEDHTNADKLHVCKVDDGGAVKDVERDENGYIQVVCGAPNVREGLLVAWIPPGATVPATHGTPEPFVLGSRELRGVVSNGMLASASELGLSDNHDGLLEIDESEVGRELTPGDPFVSIYALDDVVIDVENKMFTHRPDCFGVLGVAREIAGITGQAFKSPSWYLETPTFTSASGLPLTVKVEIPELVPRFMVVTLKNITIKPSPSWLQSALTRVGIRPINNVVDITNFVMYVTAQPLHAFDYDKVSKYSNEGAEIIVRHPVADEKVALLNGKEITPRAEAIMIASSKQLIGVGGVMGGVDTEVDDATTNIILEVANFDMYSIRRTAMAHGLFTDAVTRFNKGQSPLQNDRVLAFAMDQIMQLAGAEQASDVIDVKTDLPQNPTLVINPSFINERLGLALSIEEMHALMNNVEFLVSIEAGLLHVTAPFWRTDISIAEDVVEEIGRLYGFDHLPLVLPSRTAEPTQTNVLFNLKTLIRHALKSAGANEVLTYSFVHSDLLQKVGQDPKQAFELCNALSPNLQYYRLSLTPSLLEKIHPNQKAGYDEFAIFELGKVHNVDFAQTEDDVPQEFERLAFVYAASSKAAKKDSSSPYFKAKLFLEYLAQSLNLTVLVEPTTEAEQPFDTKRSATVRTASGKQIGTIGEYTLFTAKKLKLPNYSAGFEIDIIALNEAIEARSNYVPLPKFPKVTQDISLKVPTSCLYADVLSILSTALEDEKPAGTNAVLTPIDIYKGEETGQDIYHIAYRLSIASYTQTLQAEEVNNLLDAIANIAHEKLGVDRI